MEIVEQKGRVADGWDSRIAASKKVALSAIGINANEKVDKIL